MNYSSKYNRAATATATRFELELADRETDDNARAEVEAAFYARRDAYAAAYDAAAGLRRFLFGADYNRFETVADAAAAGTEDAIESLKIAALFDF